MTSAPPDRLNKQFNLPTTGCPTAVLKTYISGFWLVFSSVLIYTSSTHEQAYIWALNYIERITACIKHSIKVVLKGRGLNPTFLVTIK